MSAGLWVYLGQICQGLFDILVRVEFDVLELAIQETVVGRQIEVAVARKIKDDALGLIGFLAHQGLVHRRLDGVGGLRGRDDPLGFGEEAGRLKHRVLGIGPGLDNLFVHQLAEQGASPW